MASDAVLKYLTDTNRPYSCNDVTVNLRGAYGKSAVQKALDALSESGKIRCKLYGKQKVYAAIQTAGEEENDDVQDYDSQLSKLTENLEEKRTSLKKSEDELKLLIAEPKTEDARKVIDEKQQNIQTFENKLLVLKESTNIVSVDDRNSVMDAHGRLLKEYRKRKRICTDMLDAVLDGNPKTKKTLIEELCIETDESVEFKLMS